MKNDEYLKILKYWYSQELLLPQKLEPPHKIKGSNITSFDGTLDEVYAFVHKTKRQVPAGYGWEFVIYGGIYKIEKIKSILLDILHVSDDFEERPQFGNAASYAIALDKNLLPKKDGLQVSTAPWALNSIYEYRNTQKLNYEDFKNISDGLNNWLNDQEFEASSTHVFLDVNEKVLNEISASFLYEKDLYQVVATKKKLKNINDDSIDTDMLNSFYVQDIKKTIDSVNSNNNINLLSTYLEMGEKTVVNKRIDVIKNFNYVYDVLSPENMPIACWPSKNDNSLVFSQQFAINSILDRLSNSTGVYSVNGPPGTGKTTMLRDLIAMVITKRAQKIAMLDKPSDIFASSKQSKAWKDNDFQKWFSPLKENFLGDEIVVASSNNGAVENVTLEIPASKSIDKKWLDKIDFFKDTGDRLISTESWGSGAACLGNSENKSKFISNFWFNNDNNDIQGINNYLKETKDISEEITLKAWKEAKNQFLLSVKKVEDIISTRLEIKNLPKKIDDSIKKTEYEKEKEQMVLHQLKQTLNSYQGELNHLSDEEDKIEISISDINALISENITKLKSNNNKISNIQKELKLHYEKKLSFFELIIDWLAFKGKRYKAWNEKAIFFDKKELELRSAQEKLNNKIDEMQQELHNKQISLKKVIDRAGFVEASIQAGQEQISDKEMDITNIEYFLEQLKDKLSFAVIERQKYEKRSDDINDREQSSPWMDKELHNARADVFIKALLLHKALIDSNANRFRNTLACLMDVLQNKVKTNTQHTQAVEHAWATLFFFVPVVSTTFASFSRLFSHLWGEKLGWVLIDEAGQASAQAAIGAVMRAKRVVVVGDPLQLEPIIGLPGSIQDILRKEAGAHKDSLSSHTSVQKRADFTEIYGTYLKSDEENDIWVGSPLRVHRRCSSPMFEISNITTYNGLMVHGKKEFEELPLMTSRWVDIDSSINNGHWIEDEGKYAEELVRYLIDNNIEKKEIYMISPFRDVVKGLNEHFKYLNLTKKGNIGTIHTVQGKEADVVILVLGSDPENEGARNWASQKPNLVNVAATRAKERFYVVGNKRKWQNKRFFKDVAALLH